MGELENFVTHPVRDGITTTEEIESVGVKVEDRPAPGLIQNKDVGLTFRRVKEWRKQARNTLLDNRVDRLKAHDYYDGDQWDEEDRLEVEDRNQKATVFNIIKPTIDWILGTERRTRIDYRVLPRRKDAGGAAAAKTKTLKYVSDVNKEAFARSLAFEDCVISGLGWMEIGIRSDIYDEPLFVRYEDWRNVWHDPLSVERDLSDARYLFREKWVDLDVAVAMWPERAASIRAACIDDDYYFDEEEIHDDVSLEREVVGEGEAADIDAFMNRRSRVRLTECWYRRPVNAKIMRGPDLGTLNGSTFNPKDETHVALELAGLATVYDAIRMEVRQMIYTGNTVLQDLPSPYRHDRFPLVPIWGYRKKRDNKPYGAVKNIQDPQDDLNKRRSKILFHLSTNRVIADNNATDDWDELWKEAQRPDGIIPKKPGSEVRIESGAELARDHVLLMNIDAEYVEKVGGVTDENLGRKTNAISGVAIERRQEQGHTVTAILFDNLRYAFQLAGEIKLSLIEQFYTEEKVIRLTGDKGQLEFLEVNKQLETGEIENDITASQADFVVDEQQYNATLRQAMFATMGELLTRMDPQVAMALLDLWIDLSDLPGKDVMVQRIRKINGQPDPEADEDDPEAQAEAEARAEEEARQAEIAKRLQEAEALLKEAEAKKTAAEAREVLAKIDKIMAEVDKIRTDVDFKADEMKIKKADALNRIDAQEAKKTEKSSPGGSSPAVSRPVPSE